MIVACFHSFFFHTLAAPKEDGQLKNWLRGLWKRFTYVQETGHEDGKAWKSIRTQVSTGPSNSFRLDNRWSWQNKASQRTASSAFRIIQTYLDYVWVHLCASRNLVTCDILWFMFLVTFRDTRLLHVASCCFFSLRFPIIPQNIRHNLCNWHFIATSSRAGHVVLWKCSVPFHTVRKTSLRHDFSGFGILSASHVMMKLDSQPAPCTLHPASRFALDSPWLTVTHLQMSWDVLRCPEVRASQHESPAARACGA